MMLESRLLYFKRGCFRASAVRIFVTSLLTLFSLLMPGTLYSGGKKQQQPPPVETTTITDMQDRYNALAVPGVIMLPVSGTSAVSEELLYQIERELHRQIVNAGRIKPVKMDQWLLSTYTAEKAGNPFVMMNALMAERYPLPLRYMAKPAVFQNGGYHYFALYVYTLERYYPITVFRRIAHLDSLEEMIASCIGEINERLFKPAPPISRKRVVIDNFSLEFFQLAQIASGEFDFISTPFIEDDGIILRSGDDFYSRVLGYILETTNLFEVMPIGDFGQYSNAVIPRTTTVVDYRIEGRVLLSSHESVLLIKVVDVRTREPLLSLRHPLLSYNFEGMWSAYRMLSVQIIEALFESEQYAQVPALQVSGRSFFVNNMFAGWDTLENFILPHGLHIIFTGNQYQIEYTEKQVNAFYIMLENKSAVYTDMAGRRIWNLLEK